MNPPISYVPFRHRLLFLVGTWFLAAVLYQWRAEFYVEAGNEFSARTDAFIKAPILAAVALAFTFSPEPSLGPSSVLVTGFAAVILILGITLLICSRRQWFAALAIFHLVLLGVSVFSVQDFTHYQATHGHG